MLRRVAAYRGVLQCVLQCAAVCCSVIWIVAYVKMCCSALMISRDSPADEHAVAVRCSVLLQIAVCCSVFQCIAECFGTLQCVAVCLTEALAPMTTT